MNRSIIIIIYVLFLKQVLNEKCLKQCICSETKTGVGVDCRRLRYSSVPKSSTFPEKTISLDFSQNSFKTLIVMDNMKELLNLSFSTNEIEKVEPNAFENLAQLENLDLGYNQIKELPDNVFEKLVKLKYLKLTYNQLRTLGNGIFSRNILLEELDLSKNDLVRLRPEWLAGLGRLRSLKLVQINAYALPEFAFHENSKLKSLDLSGNQFKKVPTSAIRSAPSLKRLTLDRNPFRILNSDSFSSLTSLEEIQISSCSNLTDIMELTFIGMRNLVQIRIMDNPALSYIDPYAFFGGINTTSATKVSFRNNQLSTLSNSMLPWCKLNSFDLRHNPWQCDCNLKWAKLCGNKMVPGARCMKPNSLRGLDMLMVNIKDFKCAPANKIPMRAFRLTISLFSLMFLCLIGFMVILFLKRREMSSLWKDRKRGPGAIYYVKASSNPNEYSET